MQTRDVELKYLLPLIQEKLAQGQSVRFMPNGISMLPMLREGRDSVVLSPVFRRLRKYDLPLYRRDDGRFVLHRVVEVGTDYVCVGDNQFLPERGIRQDQIIALVTAFVRDGREISVRSFAYQMYCRLWHWSRGLRHFWRRGMSFLRRKLIRKIR